MRLSRYVVLVDTDPRGVVLFHTRSGVLLRIPSETYRRLTDLPPKGADADRSDPALFPLVRRRFVVSDSVNEQGIFWSQYGRFAHQGGSDLSFTVALTTACNYRCLYCFEKGTRACTMSEDAAMELAEFIEGTARAAQSLKTLSITWFGGEPLLAYPVILSLSRRLKRFCEHAGLSLRTRFISNGALLTEEMAGALKEFGLVSYQVTLDGMEEESCRYKGSTPQSYRHVRKLLATLCTSMHMTLRLNVGPHNYESVLALVDSLYADSRTRDNVSPYLAAIDSPHVACYDDEAFTEAYLAFYEHLFELGWHAPLREALPEKKTGPCHLLHERSYLIDPENHILCCENDVGGAGEVLGTIFDDPRVLLAKKEALRRSFEASIAATCRACAFFPLCFSGCPSMRRAPDRCDGFKRRTMGILKLVARADDGA